ncbi:MAG: PqqD family protein [Anaerolineales bacterium]
MGAWIWRLIEEPRSVAAIRAAVLAEFEVDAEMCQSDLQALLRDLEQNQLIEVRAAGG